MEKLTFTHAALTLSRKDLVLAITTLLILLSLIFGFGYFFGRYQQIQINKSLLKVIPDVNCGVKAK